MTSDDIIKLMRESCDTDKSEPWDNGFWTVTQEELERFANLVAAAEREACARVCDLNAEVCNNNSMLRDVLMGNAAAIRARGYET